jgi:hypothetical protein
VVSAVDRGQPKFFARKLGEARSAVKAGLVLNPTFSISRARAFWRAASDDPTYLAQLEPIFEGLCKAGVLEQ